MAQVSGLAEGLLAGFQTGNQYFNNKKEAEQRDKQIAQQKESQDRQFSLAEARYKSDDARDQRNYDRQLSRDEQSDKQFQQTLAAQREDRRASLGMQGASLNLRKQELAYQIGQQQRTQRLQEEQPIVQAFYDGVKNGNFDENLYKQISSDNPLNPSRFYGSDAIKNVQEIKTVVPGVLNGTIDYNDPRAIKVMNNALNPYIQRNIGEKVEGSDKTITKKELAHVGITEDGQAVIPTLKVTYSDGTTALKPMTDGGSSHPEDNAVTQIPIGNVMQELNGYAKVVGTLNNPAISNALSGILNQKGDKNLESDYRKDRVDISSDTAKAKANLNKDGNMSAEAVRAASAQIDQQAQQRIQELDQLYKRGGNSSRQQAQIEPDNDQALFAAFTDDYKKQFGEAPDAANAQDLQAYQMWKQAMTANPPTAQNPTGVGVSPQKKQQDSATAMQLRELQRLAQANKVDGATGK